MNSDDELLRMLAAERAEQPPSATLARGFEQLHGALRAQQIGVPVAHGPLKLGLSLAAKWGVGSGLAVFAVLSATAGLGARSTPLTSSAAAPAVPGERSQAFEPAAARSQPAEPLLPPAASGSVAPMHAKSEPSGASSTSASASSFGEEVRLIKAAKQELDDGRDQQAAALLNEHARLYPGGIFRAERDALQVLLECRRSPELGRASAQRFLAQNAASPLIDRISRACGLAVRATAPTNGNFPEAPTDK